MPTDVCHTPTVFVSGPCGVILRRGEGGGLVVPAYGLRHRNTGGWTPADRIATRIPVPDGWPVGDARGTPVLLCRQSHGCDGVHVRLPDGRWVRVERADLIYPNQ